AGMTGTADTEAAEFKKIYELDVMVVPTNQPMIRTDFSDVIYRSKREKFDAVIEEIKDCHRRGQPVLVGTISIDDSEKLAKKLSLIGLPHEVLNAKNHEGEAQIVAMAGQKGQVTISTNMAGRGTDIVLGQGVTDLGGLHILGTERHESRRIDNQLRGRAGRQGDPGSSRFFLSLEDDLLRIFGGERIQGFMNRMMEEGEPIEHSLISRAIENAQRKVEGHNFDIRKQLIEYDDVMNQQREVIYRQRREALSGESLRPSIEEMVEDIAYGIAATSADDRQRPEDWDWKAINDGIYKTFGLRINLDGDAMSGLSMEGLAGIIRDVAMTAYGEKEQSVGEGEMRHLERMITLQVVDQLWKDHLLSMDHLKQGIGLRGYAQQNPLIVYKKEGYEMFVDLITRVKAQVVRILFHVQIQEPAEVMEMKRPPRQQLAFSHGDASEAKKKPEKRSSKKVGRNDPCSCGSGKKYKKCCGT
ncbi:MAG: SEC-C metal-binding domain-containing protein, partial [Pseudomonadota bacterium]